MTRSERQTTLDGRWALVTGAAKRIGAVIARTLHDAGANVAIHYFSSGRRGRTSSRPISTRRRTGSAFAVGADVRDVGALERMARNVLERTGRLDVLVNNASNFYPTPLGTITEEQWHDLIDSNLKAPLFLSQAVLPALRAARGVIINIVDVHAQRPLRDHPVYGAAKAGLAMLTRSLAKDLGPNIRVNGVSPGAILWPDVGHVGRAPRRDHPADRAQAQRRARRHRGRRAVPRPRRAIRHRPDHRRRRRPQRRLVGTRVSRQDGFERDVIARAPRLDSGSARAMLARAARPVTRMLEIRSRAPRAAPSTNARRRMSRCGKPRAASTRGP